ncbi:hypothetical protein [Cohnella sp. WQ 127256]|uniref:hypothetical protein n=1 Tax=Cohnella sp. WQ 127256 TaxID=2938790 RepID=UPI002118BABE|nr:hypothetical protein [Cohnella sp. WQ 127256]
MDTSRLADFGITNINAKIFSINPKLTEINKGAEPDHPFRFSYTKFLVYQTGESKFRKVR